MLSNQTSKCEILNIDFNRHALSGIIRATVEAIAFSFVYGAYIMKGDGLEMHTIKAGYGNLFHNELFCEIVSSMTGCNIEIYDTNGAVGAARAALSGDGPRQDLKIIKQYSPDADLREQLTPIYK